MANAFFSDLLSTISERGRSLLRRGEPADGKEDASDLIELCEALLSGRGEASGTAMAREVLDRYHELDATGRVTFFEALARDFGPDRAVLTRAIEAWQAQPGDGTAPVTSGPSITSIPPPERNADMSNVDHLSRKSDYCRPSGH